MILSLAWRARGSELGPRMDSADVVGAGNVSRPTGRQPIVHTAAGPRDPRQVTEHRGEPEERQPGSDRPHGVKPGHDPARTRNRVHRPQAICRCEAGMDRPDVDGRQIDGLDHTAGIGRSDQGDGCPAPRAATIKQNPEGRLVPARSPAGAATDRKQTRDCPPTSPGQIRPGRGS